MMFKSCQVVCRNMQVALVVMIAFLWMQAGAASSSDLVTAIEQRYYMIMRLKKPIATLVEAYEKKAPQLKNSAGLFKNPLIYRTFVVMERTKSAMPFYQLWSCFLAYKFIEDKEFIKEMLTAILLLYKDLILSLHKESTNSKALLEDADTVWREYKELCPTTDCQELNAALTSHHTIHTLHERSSTGNVEEHIGTIHHLLDQQELDTIATDNTMRFYYIQRLLKAMFILSRQKKEIPFIFDTAIRNNLTCPLLKKSVDGMVAQKRVDPLFEVWSPITAYDFINDANRVREFVLITCLAYRQIVSHLMASSVTKALDAQDVLVMYEKLASLPIGELLDLLDDVVEQYDTLAQQYALKDSSLSWKQWFDKYWWSAPVVVGSFVTTLLKHAKLLLFSINITSSFKKERNCGIL